MKKILGKIGAIIIAIVLMYCNFYYSVATTKTQLNNEKNNLNEQIDEKKDEISQIEENKSEALQKVEELTVQISEYQSEIDELTEEIKSIEKSIADSEAQLTQAEEDYEEQEALLNERLVTIYEEGDASYLDVLLSSASLTEFLSNYFLVSELAETDTELLQQIEDKKKDIETKKAQLEKEKEELDTKKANKVKTSNALQASKATQDKYVAQLSSEEKQAQKELEEFEADKRAIEAELKKIAQAEEEARKKAEASGGSSTPIVSGTPSSSGYIFPIPGLSKANINVKTYPSYPGHTGVDINIGVVGKTIVAVKDGTVVTSEAKIKNGKYYSYGEYIVINHHDGTMTLYAHGLAGSRKVSVGQEVKQGQALMTVGSTGNSTGPHLHFEVRINGSPVNPLPYLPG